MDDPASNSKPQIEDSYSDPFEESVTQEQPSPLASDSSQLTPAEEQEPSGEPRQELSGIVRFITRISGGFIKTEQQANYVMIAIAIVAIVLAYKFAFK